MKRRAFPRSVLAVLVLIVLALPALAAGQGRFSLRLFAGPSLSSGGDFNDGRGVPFPIS